MMARAIFCKQDRLAGARRRDDQAALALADRRDQVDDAARQLLAAVSRTKPRVRVQRRQVLEVGAPAVSSGRAAVDQLDLHQGEVVLPLDRQADRPFDDQAGPQAQAADLARRDVDVFRRGQVVVGLAAQEAVAVGQHFERAGAADDLAALDLPADDADDELAAVHAGVLGDAFASRRGRRAWASAGGTGRPGASRARPGVAVGRRRAAGRRTAAAGAAGTGRRGGGRSSPDGCGWPAGGTRRRTGAAFCGPSSRSATGMTGSSVIRKELRQC